MKLRTKIFLAWSSLILGLWAATLWSVQQSITSNFERMADDEFAGARRSVEALEAERLKQMRQACSLVMNIPELRALIAEASSEISEANLESLNERLDGLSGMVGVDLVCVLDSRGTLVAQNHDSPWPTLEGLREFFARSPQAATLVRDVLEPEPNPVSSRAGAQGLWVDNQRLFQVVAMPLVFDDGSGRVPTTKDGALVMASTITDELTTELAKAHDCQITFLTRGLVFATTLANSVRQELEKLDFLASAADGQAFEMSLMGTSYRSWLEPVIDPSSKQPVGHMLVQMSHEELQATRWRLSRLMLAILGTGVLAAAFASYLLSGAVTRPIADLMRGVRNVADGDLELSLRVNRRDELGTLAGAFNDMVSQLRTRRELQRLVEESQAANRAKSQFLANMSHEIRTPLNGVVGLTQLLLGTQLDDRQRRYAELVQSSAKVLTTLINDVLDFSKIEAGKLELESIVFSPVTIIEEVLELLAPKAHGKNIEIIGDVGCDLPATVRGDPNRTRQILLNLVSNAIKFTEQGHVIVRAICQEKSGDSTTLHFEVIDTGIGIPKDRQGQLFQSFSQVDASTTRKHGGTGLGLAICKQLAELMGGVIGVESEIGRGSRFWVTAKFKSEDAKGDGSCSRARFTVRSALVADSHRQSAEITQKRLEELGIAALIAGDGAELLAKVRDRSLDIEPSSPCVLLVAEEIFETLSGQLHTAAAQPGVQSHFKLVLLAKSDLNFDGAWLHSQGFNSYLLKPVTSSKLRTLLQDLTDGSSQVRQNQARPVAKPVIANGAAPRARILLAEDNHVNQIVVVDMLTNAGFQCDVVSDGAAAVNAATGDLPYDLILMDCQMPRMDGFEATRQIRQAELARGATLRVPIIALTASAISGDKQKCLDAGMDGYCTKPVTADTLISLVESFVNRVDSPARPAQTTSRPDLETASTAIDFDALLRRCGGKNDLVQQVLNAFAANMADSANAINDSIAQKDVGKLAKVAHSLKGAAGMAGAISLHQAALDLETTCRTDQLDSLNHLLERLRQEIDVCRKCVDSALASGSKSPTPEQPRSESHARTDRG